MVSDISERILKKLDSAELDPAVKNFLVQMLEFELDHISESMPRYAKDYQRAILTGARSPKKSQ